MCRPRPGSNRASSSSCLWFHIRSLTRISNVFYKNVCKKNARLNRRRFCRVSVVLMFFFPPTLYVAMPGHVTASMCFCETCENDIVYTLYCICASWWLIRRKKKKHIHHLVNTSGSPVELQGVLGEGRNSTGTHVNMKNMWNSTPADSLSIPVFQWYGHFFNVLTVLHLSSGSCLWWSTKRELGRCLDCPAYNWIYCTITISLIKALRTN